jgi:nickel-dependent lactate racemase
MLYYAKGSENAVFSLLDLKEALYEALNQLGSKEKVLAIPPDYTRYNSHAGVLTQFTFEYYGPKLTDVLPALGTHSPMTDDQLEHMFKDTPKDIFRVHDWRSDVISLGEVPAEFVESVSEGKVNYPWPAQVNRRLVDGGYDLILSLGQVVPHEVVGMANYNKNIFVGTGGQEGINKSHFLGAAYGMERMMGRADTPVRKVLNYASDNFAQKLPIVYVLTVVGRDVADGSMKVRGVFIGDDYECFKEAAKLSLKVNFEMLDKPPKKMVVFLDPDEYKSTWLGNKSIYRTRMAIDDGGELIILAPGVREFGEDATIDRLIRKYGYVGAEKVLKLTDENLDLQDNLSAAAHLIHGSSEDRFTVTYCPGQLSKEEVEGVNFNYAELGEMMKKYDPKNLKDGFNLVEGEEIYYISNPGIGLWAYKDRF